jgi:hypothetical protein
LIAAGIHSVQSDILKQMRAFTLRYLCESPSRQTLLPPLRKRLAKPAAQPGLPPPFSVIVLHIRTLQRVRVEYRASIDINPTNCEHAYHQKT